MERDISAWTSSLRQVKTNEAGYKWASENAADIKNKKAEYLPKWQSKGNQDKQVLSADSGR